MYRAMTWKALRDGVDLDDAEALRRMVHRTRLDLRPRDGAMKVLCDGRDVTQEIRSTRVTENIFHLADEPGVRRALIEQQREFGRRHDLVTEGRDQGTDVFPDADVKFYLDASVEERARRRLQDLSPSERTASLDSVRRQIATRDAKDSARPMGALRKREDMIVVDSTDLSVDEVVERMLVEIERRSDGAGRNPGPTLA